MNNHFKRLVFFLLYLLVYQKDFDPFPFACANRIFKKKLRKLCDKNQLCNLKLRNKDENVYQNFDIGE